MAMADFQPWTSFIRIDIDAAQIKRRPHAIGIAGEAREVLQALLDKVRIKSDSGGTQAAERTREAAKGEIGPRLRNHLGGGQDHPRCSARITDRRDSAQPVYAANLYYDHDRPAGWFNSATGYGALGYAAPAAIGAQLGAHRIDRCLPDRRWRSAVFAGRTWISQRYRRAGDLRGLNNNGYQEIETSMVDAGSNRSA